jgi:hypothetical protein
VDPREINNQGRARLAMPEGQSKAIFIANAHRPSRAARMEPTGDRERNPVPPQRWHLTTLSPFLSRPLPSQFLHFCFFLMLGPLALAMTASKPGAGTADLIQRLSINRRQRSGL